MNEVSVTLDISKHPHRLQTLRIGQNDKNAPNLLASIEANGVPFPLDGWSAAFEVRDSAGVAHSFTGSTSGNVASFSLSGMSAGHTDIAYAVLEKGNMRISTQRVSVDILEGNSR